MYSTQHTNWFLSTMKVSSPSSNGKLETDSNSINTTSRSSELVRHIPVKNNTSNTISYNRPPKKVLTSSLVRLGKTERKLKMKKLFKWLFVKEKQEPEYFFEPVWTPYEENERKYEARKKREQELLAKYGNR